MTVVAVNQRGDFLNEKQKELKAKIITECMTAIFDNVKDNVVIFDNLQELLDLHFSILVILNREVLVHIFQTSGAGNQRGKIMRNMFEVIQKEVNLRVREKKNA